MIMKYVDTLLTTVATKSNILPEELFSHVSCMFFRNIEYEARIEY